VKIYKLFRNNLDYSILTKAKNCLKNGGIVIFPTDTVFGISANVFEKSAVDKIYKLKKRNKKKPLSVIFDCLKTVKKYLKVDFYTENILKKNLPGPFTFVLKIVDFFDGDFLGFRLPDCKISQFLAKDFPIVSSSANISGESLPVCLDDLKKIEADIILYFEENFDEGIASGVYKINDGEIFLIRKGGVDL